MTMARASGTGPSQAEPQERLGPTGFDPSRLLSVEQAEALGYVNIVAAPLGHVFSMETSNGYRVVAGSPSYESAIRRARPEEPGAEWSNAQMSACAQRCADAGDPPCWDLGENYSPCEECASDSDGSPKGGDASCGSVHESAGPKDIAQGQSA